MRLNGVPFSLQALSVLAQFLVNKIAMCCVICKRLVYLCQGKIEIGGCCAMLLTHPARYRLRLLGLAQDRHGWARWWATPGIAGFQPALACAWSAETIRQERRVPCDQARNAPCGDGRPCRLQQRGQAGRPRSQGAAPASWLLSEIVCKPWATNAMAAIMRRARGRSRLADQSGAVWIAPRPRSGGRVRA